MLELLKHEAILLEDRLARLLRGLDLSFLNRFAPSPKADCEANDNNGKGCCDGSDLD